MSRNSYTFRTSESYAALNYQWFTLANVSISSVLAMTEESTGVWVAAAAGSQYTGSHYRLEITETDGTEVASILVDSDANEAGSLVDTSGEGGYEFTGGFLDRTTGTAGASDVGSNVDYTQDMVNNDRWLRFAFDPTQQATNDVAYWSDPTPSPTAGIGLFGGSYMPDGVDSMFDFTFNASTFSDAVETGDFQYTAADGSFDFTQCRVGDLAIVRFDYNILPQIANTTVETALIWQTRDSGGTPTATFALTGEPKFFGTGSVGQTYLARPLLTAYFASNEDVNARALLAIRADNPVQVQPLTTLTTIQR